MSAAEPRGSFLDIDGVQIRALDWGGDGDPIVILHATGLLGRVYRPFAEAFRQIGHVWSFDQRGHGDSGLAPDDAYGWDYTMRDLEACITARGWRSVRAFGHSAGATAIGSLASERPDLISRAVLTEPVIFESPNAPELGWRNPFVERTLKRRRTFDGVDAMFQNFENKPPYDTWRKDILRDYCEFGTRATADGRRELKCSPEIEAKYYERAPLWDGLGRILRAPVPLLIMFGARSDSLGKTLSASIAQKLNYGRVIDVEHAGHFLPMEQPELVAEKALEFFRNDGG